MSSLPAKLERWLFYLLVASVFFAPFNLHPVRDGLIIAIAVVWLARRIILKDFRLPSSPLHLPFACYLFLCLLSSIVSPEPLVALDGFRSDPLKFGILYLGALDAVKGIREIRWLLGSIIAAMGVLGIVGAAGWFSGTLSVTLAEGQAPRAISLNGSYTFLGLYMLIGLTLAMAARPHIRNAYARTGLDIATVAGLVTLVLTFTRGAWVGTFFALVILVSILRRKGPAIALGGLVLLFFFLSGLTAERVMSIFQLPDYAKVAIPNRLPNWKIAGAMIRDRPFIGMGSETSIMAEIYKRNPQYHEVALPGFHPLPDAHNTYIQIILECGIPGFIALAWFFTTFALSGLRARRSEPDETFRNDLFIGLLSAIAGLWIYGVIGHFWADELGQTLTIMMVALTAGVAVLRKDSPAETTP